MKLPNRYNTVASRIHTEYCRQVGLIQDITKIAITSFCSHLFYTF